MPRALVAGGGIAGMAAAAALARAGWTTTVCERAGEITEVGAGLQMSPNACRVLDWLGVLSDVEAHAFRPQAAVLRDGVSGAEIYRAPLGAEAEARWGAPYLHVHRADLLRVLHGAAQAAGAEVRLGTPVDRVVEHTAFSTVHLGEGEIVETDLVLGADGIRSALRSAVTEIEPPRFSGQIAWRALVPADHLAEGLIPPDATVWAGEGRHLVTYFIRGGALVNIVAVLERKDWTEEGWALPGNPDELRASFADWHPTVRTLLAEVDDCFLWGLFDRPEQVRWVRGRMALIGDAAHPMLPFMAQGAAQALEDVAALIRHLRGAKAGEALEAWEEERWPRATRVLQTAQANGRMFHRSAGPVRAASRAVIGTVSKLMPGVAAGQLDWLYGFDAVKGP